MEEEEMCDDYQIWLGVRVDGSLSFFLGKMEWTVSLPVQDPGTYKFSSK